MPVGNPKEPVRQVSPRMVRGKTSFIDARFDTKEEAVKHAAAIFNPASITDDFEVGGFVVKDENDKFYFTFTLGERGKGSVYFPTTRPMGHSLVGIWHSHGNEGPAREHFSMVDYEVAKKFQLPSYMVDYRGDLRRMDAGTAQPQRFSMPAGPEHPPGSTLEADVVPGVVIGRVRDEIGEELFPRSPTPSEANAARSKAQTRQRYNLPAPRPATAKIRER